VDRIATRGRRYTCTCARFTVASTPITPGVIGVPGASTTSPLRMFSPSRRMSLPGLTARLICTRSNKFLRSEAFAPSPSGGGLGWGKPLSIVCVSSTRITASAPCGIGAPVMMRAHCPDASVLPGMSPALMSSMISSIAGTAVKSTLRNA
jgi:hypothetical protein